MIRLYLSNDTSARAAGAERLTKAWGSQPDLELVRTSSRGAFFLEPLVERDMPDGRLAWFNVKPEDLPLILSGTGGTPVNQIPFLARQTRVTFANFGVTRPLSLDDYRAQGGFQGLERARDLSPQAIIEELKTSQLRGRGGAAFPAWTKWQVAQQTSADRKYVVANADEGDAGTYCDRMIMEGEPFRLIEGMLICARAIGATRGYIYCRQEYPAAARVMRKAIEAAEQAGLLTLADGRFSIDVFVGAGSYVCGEETALLESLEGRRGVVRAKPPYPAVSGLYGSPTIVSNVLTFATVPGILTRGGAWYASMGTERSRGTVVLQIGGRVKQPGLVEIPFGATLEDVITRFGGGMAPGARLKAVQVGGPLGSLFPASRLDTKICYDAFAEAGAILGHGGIVVFDDEADMLELARHFMAFTADESCGKCTPCRIGSIRGREILERIQAGRGRADDLELLVDLGETMKAASLCALGQRAPYPVLTAIEHFESEFRRGVRGARREGDAETRGRGDIAVSPLRRVAMSPIAPSLAPSSVTLTINGRRVTAQSGETVYTAAWRAGIAIPSLCASKHLAPFGSCRLCLCEVEGQPGAPASCTTPAREGMVVRTDSDRLIRHRRNIVELYLSEQPGEPAKPLRDLAEALGLTAVRYATGAQRLRHRDESNPFFSFDNDLCISCARCVRACDEIQGTFALTMAGRGFEARPMAGAYQPSAISYQLSAFGFASSNCVSCGACVKECPTGALRDKSILRSSLPTRQVRTTCAYCGVGCAFDAGLRDGRIVSLAPADNGPSNRGHACMKGRYGWSYIYAPDRLRVPMLRRVSGWTEITWNEALDWVAQEFTRIKNSHGPDALATISSSRGTNEENYLFAKFMRCVIGTNHIDNCARVCHSATVTGMMEVLGASAATNSIQDLDQAKLIFVIGANPTESHPVVGARIKQAHRRGIPLIVADPRRTELARLADLHLQLRPGANVALLNGLGHVIVKEGLLDRTFIAARADGLQDWMETVASCTPEFTEQIAGVPAEAISQAARLYAASGASMCLHGLGVTEHRWGSHGVIALCNLALATGNIGRPGTGINPLRGQNNVQGASDMGCLPTYFAGYQSLDDPALSARHLAITGRPLPAGRGMKTPDMWDAALEGRLKGLWIIGYDVAQTDPDLKKVREALSRLEFLVVQELFFTETAKFAHLVIPGASFLEKDGTFTNLERRIQRIRKAVDPPDGVLPDWQVASEVATRMGYPMKYAHPSEIMDEIAQLTPSLAGVSYERLDRPEGLQWPVPSADHPGTALMHGERFPRGKARFVPVDYLPPGEELSEAYPFVLVTGRILQHYNCGAQTRRTDIVQLVDADVLEMHPEDAASLGLANGEPVRLVSERGEAVLPLAVSRRVQRGQLFTSFHFPVTAINQLLSSSADESSKCPEYKVSTVRVEKLQPARHQPARMRLIT